MNDDTEPLPLRAQFPRRRRSSSTLAVYQAGMASYEGFCEQHGYQPHPADVHVVRRWLEHLYTVPGKGNRPTSPDTAKTYLAAVKLHQLQQHDEDPRWPILDSEQLRDAMAAYRWRYTSDGHAPPDVDRFTAGHLLRLLAWLDRDTLTGRRDAAVVSALYGATARRDEVAHLRVEDVQLVDGGVRVWFPVTGRATFIEPNPAEQRLCPVQAIREYLVDLRGHGISQGPMVGVMYSPRIWPDEWKGISPVGISAIVTRACAGAGLGHHTAETVRAGSAKDVADASGGDLLAVTDAGGWRDANSTRKHVGERRVHATLLGAVLASAQPVPAPESGSASAPAADK